MLLEGILLSLFAGLAIPLGACLARLNIFEEKWKKEEFKHSIIGFGAGALIAAISFVLIPDGAEKQPDWLVIATFITGGITFMLTDIYLHRTQSKASNFIAMMLDFVPEAIVLGAIVVEDFKKAIFIAIIIAAQNIPEGYAAFTEMKTRIKNQNKLIVLFILTGITGPIYSLLGTTVFTNTPLVLGMIMSFCAGGILYLVFQDIAPRVSMKKSWLPPLGTIIGFTIGLIGYLYIK
tara:strand:- start:246 stop:950 length:705 start_codon:yes stop_codon:yes gene_type:complete